MIRFFRSIRQKLLAGNRFRKYLLYALGEIILVVIGILIALQINTWNEQVKIAAEEKRILVNIKTDLVKDTVQMDNHIKATLKRDSALTKILNLIASDADQDKGQIIQLCIGNIPYENYFSVNSGTFDESVAAGSIKYISSELLRQHIFDYYRIAKRNPIDREAQAFESEITDVFFRRIMTTKEVMSSFEVNSKIPELNIASLGKDIEFVSTILRKLGYQYQQRKRWGFYMKEARRGIDMINEELGSE